jgi:predicted DNA-binding transcriptional regulator AlpA
MVTERISGGFSRGDRAFGTRALARLLLDLARDVLLDQPLDPRRALLVREVAKRRLVLTLEGVRSELGFVEASALVSEIFEALPLLEDADVFARYRSAKWLTAKDVSQRLGLSRDVVHRMMETWTTAHQRTSGGPLYVAEHEVLAWAAEATANATTTVRRRR